jgi:2-thiouracil desulfurase
MIYTVPQQGCQNDPVLFNMTDPKTKTELQHVRIGISSCLLGERVRYDGGHKRDSFLADIFGRYVEWVAVCPGIRNGAWGPPRVSSVGE